MLTNAALRGPRFTAHPSSSILRPVVRGMPRRAQVVVLLAAASLTLALRLYLASAGICLSVDGIRYLQAATEIAQGNWKGALSSFYPPGYPAAIAGARLLTGDFETAAVALSITSSLLLLLPLAALVEEARVGSLASAATLLGMALSPYPARYAATVRSEALYALLFLLAVWLASLSRSGRCVGALRLSGVVAGFSYLVRPEGLALALPLGLAATRVNGRVQGTWISKLWEASQPLVLAIVIALPYIYYLRADTGHLILSRKTANVLSLGIREATGQGAVITQEESARTRLVEVLRERIRLLPRKLAIDLIRTFAAFAECLHFVFVPFLLIGIVECRRRRLALDRFLHAVVWFYLGFFALVFVNRRFYAALVPLAMIWCGVGFEVSYRWLQRRYGVKVAGAMAALTCALILAKGVRVSSCEPYLKAFAARIAGGAGEVVVASDPRIAFFAGRPEAPASFPVRTAALAHLLTQGHAWLAVRDEDLTADSWRMIEGSKEARLEMRLRTERGATVSLYHLLGSPGKR